MSWAEKKEEVLQQRREQQGLHRRSEEWREALQEEAKKKKAERSLWLPAREERKDLGLPRPSESEESQASVESS